jgi:putative tricarboxylic transport membrane protein
MWLQGFELALSGLNPLILLLGTLIGLVVGVLPAVGPSFGVTLALPFTYGMDPATALIFLCAIQSACAYGDSFASILLNVPGGPGTVASCWEGYPLTRQGKGGTALGIATGASLAGGILGWLSFVALAGPMTAFAIMIGSPEYFVLGVMALALISIASKGETIKGLIMGCLGLLMGMIGSDPVSGMTFRFNFGLAALEPGVEITLGALAIFALPQLIEMLEEGGTIVQVGQIKDSVIGGIGKVLRRPWSVLRGGIIGWLIGVLPALGTSAAGISAYLVEKKFSPESDQFGKGSMDGLTAAETAKGACILGDGITSLMLGIPGSVTWAILMAALIIHGVQPGPRFMTAGVLPYTVFAGLLLGQVAYFVIGILFARYMAKVAHIPNQILAPVVAILCFMGAFAAKNYVYDIWIMVALGIFAFGAQRNGYPPVPMILGFILADLIEANFHRALGVGFGSYTIFISRPISLTLVIVTLGFLAWPWIVDLIRRRRLASGKSIDALDAIADKEVSEIAMGELVFGGWVALLLIIFLWASFRYSPEVRLFPVIVCVAGLGLTVIWFFGIARTRKIRPFAFAGLSREKSGLPWLLGLALLAGYAVLVPVLGLMTASIIYFPIAAVLSGYKLAHGRWWIIAATTAGVGVLMFVFAHFLRIELPVGLLGW